jgi:hypothetical protein
MASGVIWPGFLGPDRNNASPAVGLLDQWPATGPNLAGTIRGLGVGFSNISIADGLVHTMGNLAAKEVVLAIRLESGRLAWKHELGPAYRNSFGDGPRSTPAIDGDRLYALGAAGDLVCLDRRNGKRIWRLNIAREFQASVPQWGYCESVLIDGDNLICTPGGRQATLVALDKRTGALRWKALVPEQDGPAYASLIRADFEGSAQYVQMTAKGVVGVRADDGQYLWRDNSSANGTANCCAPVFAGGMVFTASGYGKGGAMVRLLGEAGAARGRFAYHTRDMQVQHGGLVLFEGHVYGSSDPGVLTCLDLETGAVRWQNRSIGKSSLTMAEGHLYLREEVKGTLALVAATPEGYQEKGRFQPPERSSAKAWSYPVVCDGKLFLRDQDLLQVYDVSKP